MVSNDDSSLKEDKRRLQAVRPFLEKRQRALTALRRKLGELGFLEVETPLRIHAPAPEPHIDAEPSGNRFLITSPELQMKRLLAAGYEKIFQVCRCFRQGERGDRHLPEFTMIEWYRIHATIEDLMEDCELLIEAAGEAAGSFPIVGRQGRPVDLRGPWERIEVKDAFEKYAGWRPGADPDPDRFNRGLAFEVEPSLPMDRPVFLVGYPAAMAALARLDPTDSSRAERFELFAGGLELANGYTELVDPVEQARRFKEEAAKRGEQNRRAYPIDERFLGSLRLGLDPCAGIALGFDRLVMLLTGAEKIDDVVAFPEGTV
jgi:lysyl-tRNA synthetase class 2